MFTGSGLPLSDERLTVSYRIRGSEAEALSLARDAALEQSVELSDRLVEDAYLRNLVGRVDSHLEEQGGVHLIGVSYPIELAASIPAFLSVVYSNISFYRNIRIDGVGLPEALLKSFRGPKFGHEGLRRRLGVERATLVGTALKPVGSSPESLAATAYIFARNGIEIIKDDHGLNNQMTAPLRERVRLCSAAIERASGETGRRALYFPNVTGRAGETRDNALFAQEAGAGGVEILPGLCGFDELRALAEDPEFDLPVLLHPANLGTYAMSRSEGMSFRFLFGQLARLSGADVSAFPSFGGRFAIDPDECRRLAEALNAPMGELKPAFSMAGGGQTIARIPAVLEVYGKNTVLLISGALFDGARSLAENCQAFRRAVEAGA